MAKEKKKKSFMWVFVKIYIPSLLVFAGYQIYLHSKTKPKVIYNSTIHHQKENFMEWGISGEKKKVHVNKNEKGEKDPVFDGIRNEGDTPVSEVEPDPTPAPVTSTVQEDTTMRSPGDPGFAIFYNSFVNPANVNQSLKIVAEQLDKIDNSTFRTAPIYYNLIGANLTNSVICPDNPNCNRIRYQEQGEEVITLQDLHEYCVEHPLDVVVYLHDKGSFNPSGNNNRIRKIATASAVSEACRTSSKQGCNLCVNKFMFLPNHHTPGAMWTGNCSYLRTLIPPKDFDARRQEMFRAVRQNQTLQDQLHCVKALVHNFEQGTEFGGDQWKYMSIFRYAMEHWAFSGPDLSPCNTIPGKMKGIDSKKWKPNVTMGTGPVNFGFERATATGWYQLEGRKLEFMHLYGRLPPKNSFFWAAYRDAKVPKVSKLVC